MSDREIVAIQKLHTAICVALQRLNDQNVYNAVLVLAQALKEVRPDDYRFAKRKSGKRKNKETVYSPTESERAEIRKAIEDKKLGKIPTIPW